MSQMKAFFDKAMSDKDLMAKLDELGRRNAEDEELISLAAENSFFLTKKDIEKFIAQASKSRELSEEDLENVAGGEGSRNRWDRNRCMSHGRTMYECVGFLGMFWCDYYRRTNTGRIIEGVGNVPVTIYNHYCTLGAFNYDGLEGGSPV